MRMIVAVENHPSRDGRLLSETRLPGMVHVMRLPVEGQPPTVLGWLTHWRRERQPEVPSYVPDLPVFFLTAEAKFPWRQHLGLSPAVDIDDAQRLQNSEGLLMARGGRIAAVVLVPQDSAPWLGLEITP